MASPQQTVLLMEAGPGGDALMAALRGPSHIAIIMDGNRRWAQARNLRGAAGHRAGADRVRPVAEACANRGIETLTLFGLSTENLERPRSEVRLLMQLLRRLLRTQLDALMKNDIRLRIVGDRGRFDPDLQTLMVESETATQHNGGLTLVIAVSYGGRWDIVQATRALAVDVAAGRLTPEDIDDKRFSERLSLAGLPSPDLCIRTGGDHRISNFLLWDFAYTELFFTDTFWPDFGEGELDRAIASYACRDRRFGRR